ncbi:unnamed protein product [Caenorhabditis nigoni]
MELETIDARKELGSLLFIISISTFGLQFSSISIRQKPNPCRLYSSYKTETLISCIFHVISFPAQDLISGELSLAVC